MTVGCARCWLEFAPTYHDITFWTACGCLPTAPSPAWICMCSYLLVNSDGEEELLWPYLKDSTNQVLYNGTLHILASLQWSHWLLIDFTAICQLDWNIWQARPELLCQWDKGSLPARCCKALSSLTLLQVKQKDSWLPAALSVWPELLTQLIGIS